MYTYEINSTLGTRTHLCIIFSPPLYGVWGSDADAESQDARPWIYSFETSLYSIKILTHFRLLLLAD